MDGIQKTVFLGLAKMAENVKDGKYGVNDNVFDDDDDNGGDAQVFLDDLTDEVISKME